MQTQQILTRTIVVCESQPVTVEGLKACLRAAPDLEFLEAAASLELGLAAAGRWRPSLLLVDKSLGLQAVVDAVQELKAAQPETSIVVWAVSITESEVLRLLQAGARGIVRKTAEPRHLLACLRSAAAGVNWMDEQLFREASRAVRYPRSELTPREQQVMELVEKGQKNREIAKELGIQPGTVKIHLKHIFEKTGVHGRYGLALAGMKERGAITVDGRHTNAA